MSIEFSIQRQLRALSTWYHILTDPGPFSPHLRIHALHVESMQRFTSSPVLLHASNTQRAADELSVSRVDRAPCKIVGVRNPPD